MARDPRDLEDLIELVEHHGIVVRSVTGSLNLFTDADVTMARVLVAMANKSSRDTARRVGRAAQRNAELGRWRGKRCTGYEADGSLVPVEAEAIRDAVQAVIAGASLHEIARRWDQAGLVRLQGGQWREQPTKVRDVLVAWRIAGVPVHKGQPLDVEAQWPAIITREQLQQVRDILLSGGVAARSTLSRSLAPGMHGWQKKIDSRELAIVIDGPDAQWVVDVPAGHTLVLKAARQFAAAVNTAACRVGTDLDS